MAQWNLAFNTKGPKGDPGTGLLFSDGAPTASAIEGQGNLDTTNAVLYVYSNGNWVLKKQLVGPMGLSGVDGSFFGGNGAPTSATYNGTGQAVYFQSTGELWFYKQSTGWVDSGESYFGATGPKGDPGAAGLRGSQLYNGSGAPPSDTTSAVYRGIPPVAGDRYEDTSSGVVYYFS